MVQVRALKKGAPLKLFQIKKRSRTEPNKENIFESSPEVVQVQNEVLLIDSQVSREKLYGFLQINETDRVKAFLMIMAFNEVGDAELVENAYKTMNTLLPSFNQMIFEGLPIYRDYSHIDIVCSFPRWHDAAMIIFFDELRKGALKPIPVVKRALFYGVKQLEATLERILRKVIQYMTIENPLLLKTSVRTFFNPHFVGASFEVCLYGEIFRRLHENALENDTPASIFDTISCLESDYNGARRTSTSS